MLSPRTPPLPAFPVLAVASSLLLSAASAIAAEQALDLGWRFHRGDVAGAEAREFDDSAWRALDLPHDWSIEDLPAADGVAGPHDRNAPSGSDVGYARGGVGWYRRTLTDAERPAGSGLELIVHGAQQECDVWVNGTHAAFQPHGYVPARVEIGRFLRPRPEPNTIAIRVANPENNSRWYSGSGLYRSVTLRGHDDLFVPTWGARVDTIWIDPQNDRASVHVRVQVCNERAVPRDADLELELTAPDGTTTRHELGQLRLAPSATEWANAWLWLSKAQLWSLETPQLYRAHFRVREHGRAIDDLTTRFGVRTVAIDAEHGFRLNGRPLELRGGNLHHDNGLLGARAFPDAERRRVRLMKANGFNAIRTAHNPPSIAFLEACDEEGMLVIDEFADSWQLPKKRNGYQRYFDTHAERDLATMIARDFNHPSVVLWSIGNEIPERFNPAGVAIGRRLAELVHREDPRRGVTASVNLLWEDPSVGDRWELNDAAFSILDVGGYNYRWQKYESDHLRHPSRVMYGAESYPNEAWENWNAVERLPFVIGDFVWSAMDYLGESGIGHTGYVDASAIVGDGQDAAHQPWPVWNSWCGDLDVIGDKKPQSLYRDVVWRRSAIELLVHEPVPTGKKEKVGSWGWPAELPSWNWPGQEGKPLQVSVYSRAPRVRLALDGKIVGEQDIDPAKGLAARFTVPWSAGTLTATALDGQRELATKSLRTTGAPAQLRLEPEPAHRRVDRAALIFVPISVVDAAGARVPDAALPLTIEVAGEAELCAFGTGDPASVGSLTDSHTTTFRGRALAILRSTGRPGAVQITVTSTDTSPARLTQTSTFRFEP
ncbi:MAG: glycoside hydrolase family 2 protein [Opitutae bacterium]|nr:glycoside hydrolase family 2 protein [Opitutae bacterium]